MSIHLVQPAEPDSENRLRSKRSVSLLTLGAVVGVVGTPLAGITGCAFLLLGFFASDPGVHTASIEIGNVALYAMLPLLLLGGFCMDGLDRARHTDSGPRPMRGPKRSLAIAVPLVFALAMLLHSSPTSAQQAIFNIPSTDVLDRGKVYIELDAPFKPVDPMFSSFVPRVVVGTGGRIEVGINITGNIQPGVDSTALAPSIKWKFYDGGDNGWAAIAGNTVTIPVRNKSYSAGNYSYAAVSKTFKAGTRVTAGGYHFSPNVVAANAQRAGGQFAIEHPITRRVTLAADWMTGNHAGGYFTPGVIYKPHPKVTLYTAYSIGNSGAGNGNHFVLLEVGYNF